MIANLRHLRIVLAVQRTRSITRAAETFHLSQPAVTAALSALETRLALPLFDRQPTGLDATAAGQALCLRITRALDILDPALTDLSPRLVLTASLAQLHALIAVTETESFSGAARRLGIAQPTVHRAVAGLEGEAGQSLFTRTSHGVIPSRAVRHLAMAAQLALAELDQVIPDLSEISGREAGRVVIGAMPLSRTALLGPAIARFRAMGRGIPVRVVEGPYAELALGLRRGAIDFLIGALRDEVTDLRQELILTDDMAIVCHPAHAALGQGQSLALLASHPWVVAPEGTPARQHFTALFRDGGAEPPTRLVETGSMELLLDLVSQSDHLAFVSSRQAQGAVAKGVLARLPYPMFGTARPIGFTFRANWHATRAQSDMVTAIRAVAGQAEVA